MLHAIPRPLVVTAAALLAACSPAEWPSVYEPPAEISGASLPPVTDVNFCQAVQQFMASTARESDNTVFITAQEYIESKTTIDPLTTYQYVTRDADVPVAASCKVKGAAYIRAHYGEDQAGEQRLCPAVTAAVVGQVARELALQGNAAAAASAQAFVFDNNEPFFMGPKYLADYELSYVGADGAVHLASQGLIHDYAHWTGMILPDAFAGVNYCNIPSHEYVRALATGAEQPGRVISMRGEESEDGNG